MQCDSFVLGEFVKFLARVGYLKFTSMLSAPEAVYECNKHMSTILAKLRECPSYQIDQFHSHCGPKKHLLAGLGYIESLLKGSGAGVCYECLEDTGANVEPLWMETKPPLMANLPFDATHELRLQRDVHRVHHARQDSSSHASEVFLAREKIWRT